MKSWGKTTLLLVSCVLVIFLAYRQGGFAAWYLGICLSLIWIQAGLFYVFALKGLNLNRRLSGDVFLAGEDVTIVLEIQHRSWVPLPWLLLKETWIHEGNGRKLTYSKLLFPWFQKSILLPYKMTHLMRGSYRLLILKLRRGTSLASRFAKYRGKIYNVMLCIHGRMHWDGTG
jgi:uncharacterized protein (DUF58 family)